MAALYFVQHDMVRTLERWVVQLHLHPGNHYVDGILGRLVSVDPRTLREIGVGTFVYAGVFLTEGVGLLQRRRWAEYLTVAVTGSFLPLELYQLGRHVTLTRLIIVGANLAIVVYLVRRVRAERRAGRASR